MLDVFRKWLIGLPMALITVSVGGCGTALNRHMESTFLSSHDLVAMTDKMAASMASNPQIAAITTRGPMVIVLTNLRNMTDTIIPRGEGDIFLHRVRVLLDGEADSCEHPASAHSINMASRGSSMPPLRRGYGNGPPWLWRTGLVFD